MCSSLKLRTNIPNEHYKSSQDVGFEVGTGYGNHCVFRFCSDDSIMASLY